MGVRSWLATATLLFVCFTSIAGAKPSEDVTKRIQKEFNETYRSVRGKHALLPMNFVEWNFRSYGYYIPRRFAQLARAGAEFRIDRFKRRDEHYRVDFETREGAKVSLVLVDQAERLSQDLLDSVFPLMISELFEFGEAGNTDMIVVNRNSGLAHIGSCNHLPVEEFRMILDSPDDYRRCPSCFPIDMALPIANYTQVRAVAVEQARLFLLSFPPVEDEDLQKRIQALGKRLLDAMPFEPLGFDYQFVAVQSNLMQAKAYPTGFVFVTDKLIESAESELELAFAIAHEIAHCELHLPPVPVPTEPNPMFPGAVEYYYKVQRNWEYESDIIGLSALSHVFGENSRRAAELMLSKLQFANESLPALKAKKLDSHPTFRERKRRISPENHLSVTGADRFLGIDKDGNTLYRIVVLGGYRSQIKSQEAYLLVEATVEANKELRIGGQWAGNIKFESGDDKEFNFSQSYNIPAGSRRIVNVYFFVNYDSFGISDESHRYPFDISRLKKIEIFDAPDVKDWILERATR